jgi:hypothetical protein
MFQERLAIRLRGIDAESNFQPQPDELEEKDAPPQQIATVLTILSLVVASAYRPGAGARSLLPEF